MTSHGWSTEKSMLPTSKPISPLPADCLSQLSKHEGSPEGSSEHLELQQKSWFSYRTLVGEMMFAYVSCQADIRYAITLMSKNSLKPSAFHYKCLKGIAKYLQTTQHWGIKYKRPTPRLDLKTGTIEPISLDSNLPPYPEDTAQGKLVCFVDAAYRNDPTKH